MTVDPVIGRSPIELAMEPPLRGRLAALSRGRPLVIDYYASRHRGILVGDLTVRFGEPAAEPRYIELEPLEGVTVLVERSLLDILDRAIISEAGVPFARHLAISLRLPEQWIEFLEHRAKAR